MLSFLIAYLLLFSYALMSRSSCIWIGIWSKVNAYSSLGEHLSSLQYRFLSIIVRLIILLAVPCYHIIVPGGGSQLKAPIIYSSQQALCLLISSNMDAPPPWVVEVHVFQQDGLHVFSFQQAYYRYNILYLCYPFNPRVIDINNLYQSPICLNGYNCNIWVNCLL